MNDVLSLLAAAAMVGSVLLVAGCDGGGEATPQSEATPAAEEQQPADADSIFAGLTMNDLAGEPVDLAQRYAGKAVVVVNTASQCGFTRQYAGLQELHKRYAEQGLAVVGVPSADFGGQEFDEAEEIAEFCQVNFGVTFDLMERSHVRGEDRIELFARLTDPAHDASEGGEPEWNFEKFIIDRQGKLIARYRSRTEPTSEEMIEAIERALAQG